MGDRKVPRFLKPLEFSWYGDDDNVKVHWRLNLEQNPDSTLLKKYIQTAVIFIYYVTIKSKHSIPDDPKLKELWQDRHVNDSTCPITTAGSGEPHPQGAQMSLEPRSGARLSCLCMTTRSTESGA